MSLYLIAKILHLLGAVGLFASLGVDAACLSALFRASTAEQVTTACAGYRLNRLVGPPSLLAVVAAGIYLAASAHLGGPWIGGSFALLPAIIVLGAAVTGKRIARLEREVVARPGLLSPDQARAARDPVLVWSFGMRIALAMGIVVLMTAKPEAVGTVLVSLASACIGALPRLALRTDQPSKPRA